jgi:hypothetical protein
MAILTSFHKFENFEKVVLSSTAGQYKEQPSNDWRVYIRQTATFFQIGKEVR